MGELGHFGAGILFNAEVVGMDCCVIVDKLWDWESKPCTGGLKHVKVVGEK